MCSTSGLAQYLGAVRVRDHHDGAVRTARIEDLAAPHRVRGPGLAARAADVALVVVRDREIALREHALRGERAERVFREHLEVDGLRRVDRRGLVAVVAAEEDCRRYRDGGQRGGAQDRRQAAPARLGPPLLRSVLEKAVPAPRAPARPGGSGRVTARTCRLLAGGACHAPEATQPTLTGRFAVTGVWPAAVSVTASVAANFLRAFLTFLAVARDSFSLRLPPLPALHWPLPAAMPTLFCFRFVLMRSCLATLALMLSAPLAAESSVHSNFTDAPFDS